MNWYKKARELTEEEFAEITEPKWQPVESRFITDVAYSPATHRFEVRIEDREGNTREYLFLDVPQEVYDNFMASESKGKFFNEAIKNKYRLREK